MALLEQPWSLELVEWVDSALWTGWTKVGGERDRLENNGMARCVSVGWVIFEDDREIKVAPNRNDMGIADSESVDGYMCIPKGCIVRRSPLARHEPEPVGRPVDGDQGGTDRWDGAGIRVDGAPPRPPHPNTMAGAGLAPQGESQPEERATHEERA